jgi:hypothetical protein
MNAKTPSAEGRPRRYFAALCDWRALYLLPILPWFLSYLLYEFGPIGGQNLQLETYLFLIAVLASLYSGVGLGVLATRRRAFLARSRREFDFERILRWLSPAGAILGVAWIYDLSRGGYEAANSINNTEYVRGNLLGTTTLVTTLTSPFVCASFTVLAYIVYRLVFMGYNVSRVVFYSCAIALAFFSYVVFLTVSRNGILQFAVLAGLTALAAGPRTALRRLRSLSRSRTILLCGAAVLFMLYFVYITVRRQDDYQYEAGFSQVQRRYEGGTRLPKSIEAPLYGGTYYFSHALGNLDRYFAYGRHDLFSYDTNWLGYVRQMLLKIGVDVLPNYGERERRKSEAGINPAEWPTGLYDIIIDFGLFGAFAFLFLLGLMLGNVIAHLLAAPYFHNVLMYALLTSFIGQLILYYPSSQDIGINIILAVIIKLGARFYSLNIK